MPPEADRPFVDELTALLADTARCSDEWPDGAPGHRVAELEGRFERLKTRWLQWVKDGGEPSTTLVHAWRMDWHREQPPRSERERRLAFDRLVVLKHMYKIDLGKPDRVAPSERSAVGDAQEWLNDLEDALKYERAVRGKTTACDCAGAAATGRAPKAELEDLGDATDGYYVGTSYRCRECGARWECLIMDDSVGSGRWSCG